MQERQVSIEGRPTPCRSRSSSSRPRTPSSSRGPSPCPRRSWTGSSLRVRLGYPDGEGGAADRPPLPGRRGAARRHRAGDRRGRGCSRSATRSARPRRRRGRGLRGRARPGDPLASRPPARGEPAGQRRPVPRRPGDAVLDGPRVRHAGRRQGGRPAVLAHRLVVDLDRSLRGATADGALRDPRDGPGPAGRRSSDPAGAAIWSAI